MKSLNKALDILEIFWSANNAIGLSELTRLSGLKRTTAGRIVSVLVDRGYLRQLGEKGKYSLGTRSLLFSSYVRQKIKLKDVATPYLIKLSELVDESVNLFNLDGEMPYLVEEIHTQNPLRVIPDRGPMITLYCTAIGKIFLANKTEQELEEYLGSTDIEAHTPNTITDPNHLKSHLKIVAKEGVAYDDEEHYIGMRNVAAGIRDEEGKVIACVGVMGPSVRLSRARMTEVAQDVKRCAMAISQILGYRENNEDNIINQPESKNKGENIFNT